MDAADHLCASATGHVHVEQHDVGLGVGDDVDGFIHLAGFAHDLHRLAHPPRPAGRGPPPAAPQPVVVDQHDPDAAHARACRGTVSATSVPVGPLRMAALPPLRVIRPTMDSRMPRRSAGMCSGSKPRPRSRTTTSTPRSVTSANTDTLGAPDDLAALTMPSRAAATVAASESSSGASPTTTTSTDTACASSTSAAACRNDMANDVPLADACSAGDE